MGIAAAVAAGVDSLEHCTFTSEGGAVIDPRIVESIVHQNIWCGITIARPKEGPPAQTLAILEKKWGNVRELMAAGARIAFSTDAGINATKPHNALPRDLAYLTEQGFTPLEVLTAATADAAASCGVDDRKGRIAPGYDADLIAVTGTCEHSLAPLLEVTDIFRAGRAVTTAGQPPASISTDQRRSR